MTNEFDCVSERPPPTTCQQRAVVVTTTTVPPTSTTEAPTTTSTSTTTSTTTTTSTSIPTSTTSTTAPVGATSANWTFFYRGNFDGTEFLAAVFYLNDANGNPISNRTVSLSIRTTSGYQVGTGQCETGSGGDAGRCSGYYGIPNWANAVYIVATAVQGPPPYTPPPQQSPTAS